MRRAAEFAGEDDVAEMEENLDAQDRADEADDLDAFYVLDDGFHRTLCDLCGHPTVWAVSERAKSHLNRVRRLSLGQPRTTCAEMIEEHRGVLAAVADHDPDARGGPARATTCAWSCARCRGSASEHPDYFEEP